MFFRRPKPQQQPFKVIRAIQAVYNRGNRIGIPRYAAQNIRINSDSGTYKKFRESNFTLRVVNKILFGYDLGYRP